MDGYLSPLEEPGLGVPYFGGYDKLDECLENPGIDEVVVALEADEIQMLPRTFAACDKHGTRITMVPFYSDYLPARPTIDVLDECKLINVRQTPFDNILNAAVKRGLDIVGSLILIVLTSPVMLVTAIGVKLSSPGPVIFRQERVGLNKKPFMMYKFRSMRVNAKQQTGWSTDYDPPQDAVRQSDPQVQPGRAAPVLQRAERGHVPGGTAPRGALPCGAFQGGDPPVSGAAAGPPRLHGLGADPRPAGDTDIAERIRYDIWYIENWTVALGYQDHLPHGVRRQDDQRRKNTVIPLETG